MKEFYKIDSTGFTFQEYRWDSPLPVAILAYGIKLLRIRMPGSVGDPNVESLKPFEVTEAEFPQEVRAKFQPIEAELASLGFQSPVFHILEDSFHFTKIYWTTYSHSSGRAMAQIHHRVWSYTRPHKVFLFPMMISGFSDGTFLVSSAGKPKIAAPPSCRVERSVGATTSALWATHQRALEEEASKKSVIPCGNSDALGALSESYHAALRDFHLGRGAFVPMTEKERQRARQLAETIKSYEGSAGEHAEVLAEIHQLQQKQSSWRNVFLVFLISLLLFSVLGSLQWTWEFALLLAPLLFVHELGHYLAMRFFRYRNLQMFFIPLFGAAVSGQNYNVPGWKKAIVSFMGPLPGIALGILLGVMGMIFDKPALIKTAIVAIGLNGFNLLPVLPLDGGWIMHSVLFCRHTMLDVGFRMLAALALFIAGLYAQDRILSILGFALLLGLIPAYRMARIASGLRQRGFAAASPDEQTLPLDVAQEIIQEVKVAFPKHITNKSLAQISLHVFETLNARPPGWLAAMGLLGLYSASLIGGVVFFIIFIFAEQGSLD